ncbi:MAG: hypothetical protein ACOX6V_05630 [Patescibacteria group bacterium]|jgi:hypothetical protein
MKLIEQIKKYFSQPSRADLLEKIEDLEKRVFREREENNNCWQSSPYYVSFTQWEPKTLEEEIEDTQEKLDALAKHLKVVFTTKPSSDEEVVATKLKQKKPKK